MFRKTLLLILLIIALTVPVYSQGQVVNFLMSGLNTTSSGMLYGGLVYAYAAGTTTAKSLYTDVTLSTLAAVPLVLDSDGRAVVYGSGAYKFVVKDQYGTTIFTADNVEVNSVAKMLDGAVDPFGIDLTQTNLSVTNLIASDTKTKALLVTASAAIDATLDMLNHQITNVATATSATAAANLGQVGQLITSAIDAFPATIIPLASASYAGTLSASVTIALPFYRTFNASKTVLVVQSIGTMEGAGTYSVGVGVEKPDASGLGWASATSAIVKACAVASYPSTALSFTFNELALINNISYRFIVIHSSTADAAATFTTLIQIEQE